METNNPNEKQTDIEQKLLPLLDKWSKLLAAEKKARNEMAEVRKQITDLMTTDSMDVGNYHLARFKNFGGYFTRKKGLNEFTYTLQIREKT
jgi:hypothetical protein